METLTEPDRTAPTPEWIDYVIARGMPEDVALASTRKDIVAWVDRGADPSEFEHPEPVLKTAQVDTPPAEDQPQDVPAGDGEPAHEPDARGPSPRAGGAVSARGTQPPEPPPESEDAVTPEVPLEVVHEEEVEREVHQVGPATVVRGECLFALREMADDSVDAVVTDPPYGLSKQPDMVEVLTHWMNGEDYEHRGAGFMGKTWDSFVPGPSVWREVYRVLKPGGHALVFAGTRTMDLMGLSLRLAGFEVRDVLSWMYGQGFPKSHNVGKAIDKAAGAEREVVGYDPSKARPNKQNYAKVTASAGIVAADGVKDNGATLTAPATDEARRWSGWGTALKPAYEPIIMVRKPFAGSVASNVLEHGTGAINIDGCRIEGPKPHREVVNRQVNDWDGSGAWKSSGVGAGESSEGRWPANVVLGHHEDCEQVGVRKVKTGTAGPQSGGFGGGMFGGDKGPDNIGGTHADGDGTEEVTAWNCVEDCPVRLLDEQTGQLTSGKAAEGGHRRQASKGMEGGAALEGSADGSLRQQDEAGILYGDSGGASRFFYCAKASRKEREAGLDALSEGIVAGKGNGLARTCATCGASVIGGCDCPDRTFVNPSRKNSHPTVKPLALMRWLVRMVTPPGGIVLDPYAGSGTTGMAAIAEGFVPYLIELDEDGEYVPIIKARLAWQIEQQSDG